MFHVERVSDTTTTRRSRVILKIIFQHTKKIKKMGISFDDWYNAVKAAALEMDYHGPILAADLKDEYECGLTPTAAALAIVDSVRTS